MNHISLSLKNITKEYPGVIALNDYSLDFHEGETHALVGENGAGKSTLIKIVSGAIKPERGTVTVGDNTFESMQPAQARRLGIEVIYQEFNLVETLSAAENIYLGCRMGKLVDYKKMYEETQRLFQEFDIDMDPGTLIRDLSPAQQQIVEILKAVSKNARILIMDEPTAPLTVKEVELLFSIIEKIKKNGVTIIYISHRLDEIFRIADRVTVMRDGCYINTKKIEETNKNELIRDMVGRVMEEKYPLGSGKYGPVALEAKWVCGSGCKDISFQVRHGEILGLAGLVGAGRTELMRVIYGADIMETGEILIDGKPAHIRTPNDAIQKYKIGLIPEDRKNQGCFLNMDVEWNCSIMNIRKLRKHGILNQKMMESNALDYVSRLNIKVPSVATRVGTLSGGNQQKVALAKTLAAKCEILIFDEPTRGIDVGAKQEIYALMRQLADQGNAIIMISSEMEELLGMSDRVMVIRNGMNAGELERQDYSQELVLKYASGIN